MNHTNLDNGNENIYSQNKFKKKTAAKNDSCTLKIKLAMMLVL